MDLNFNFDFDFEKKAIKETARIEQRVVSDSAEKKFVENEKRHYAAARALSDLCAEPAEGEQWRIVTEKSFNAYAFICQLLQGGNIDDLWLAIYRINESTVRALTEMISDGRIRHANFIISSFFNQTKKPERWALQLARFCAENAKKTRFVYLHNHAKVVAAKRGDAYFVFEGSGNMSDNARIEQYLYERSETTYRFYERVFDDLITAQIKKNAQK